VANGPVVVAMKAYKHMDSIGSGIYKPQANQKGGGAHAVECVGWGHDEEGEGFWIMKNSWGCEWGDSG